jgi:uncharacterized membrane protein
MPQFSWCRSKAIFGLIALVVISVCLRFGNLAGKAYWADEVYSSLRIFGYRVPQVQQTVAIAQPVAAPLLQQFQSPAPQLGVAATVQVLAQDDPHLPPLYFILARLWANGFGASVTAMRSLSVLFSLLTLPVVYWLAIELFRSATTARIAVVLAAVSPAYLIMAQEARFYSLWLLTTALASATLLWAIRTQTWRSWGAFTFAVAAMLYTQLLGVMTLLGYGIYVLAISGRQNWQTLQRFILAAGLGGGLFLPWFAIWLFGQRQEEETVAPMRGLGGAIGNLVGIFNRAFIDFNWHGQLPAWQNSILGIVTPFCLILTVFAFWRLRQASPPAAPRRLWLFLLLLMVLTPLPTLPLSLKAILPARYLLPSFLAMQLAIANLLGRNLITRSRISRWRLVVLALVVGLGLSSSIVMMQTTSPWAKHFSACNIQVAQLINRTPRPLVVSDGSGHIFDHPLSNILSLARSVKPETQFQIFLEPQLPAVIELGKGFSDRFLLTPSDQLLQKLEAQYPGQINPEILSMENYRGKDYCLWRLPN